MLSSNSLYLSACRLTNLVVLSAILTVINSTRSIADVYDFQQLGIVCNGREDVSAPMNKLFSEIRRRADDRTRADLVHLPPGDCLVTSPVDLSMLKQKALVIDGAGGKLIGADAGKPVVDATGSEFIVLRNLTIQGSNKSPPLIGLLIGRRGTTQNDNSDNLEIDNLKVSGWFDLAAVYNLNSETTTFNHAVLVNESSNPLSFVLIQDGINHFNVNSAVPAVRAPPDTAESFNENLFINCDIRHNGFGIPVWLAHPVRHSFIRSYIAALHARTAVVIHADDQSQAPTMLSIDAHLETSNLKDAILIENGKSDIVIRGMTLIDQYVGASDYVFAHGSGFVSIENARIEIAGSPPSTLLFRDPAEWKVSGYVYVGRESLWNLPGLVQGYVRAK